MRQPVKIPGPYLTTIRSSITTPPRPPLLAGDAALQFLAGASTALGSSLDYETTLRTVARLMVPALADWCALDVTDAAGGLRRLAVAHVDPRLEVQAMELAEHYPPDPDAEAGALHVLRTGKPEVYERLTDHMLAAVVKAQEHLELLKALDLRSYIGVPLVVHGHTLGVLSLVTGGESGRQYAPADLTLAVEVATRAAIAVDNALVHRAERATRASAERAAMRATRLQEVSLALGAAMGEAEAGAVALDAIVAVLEPHGAALMLIEPTGEWLDVTQARGFQETLLERYRRIPLHAELPVCHAVRSGRAVICETRAARSAAYPALDPELAQTGSGAIVALPLVVHERVLGALALSFADERVFTEGDRAFMVTLASQSAQAVERARLFDGERRARADVESSLRALQASELRFRTVFESGMLGIAFWNGSRVTDANDAFLSMLGYAREDVLAGEVRAGRLSPPEYREADLRATEECRLKRTCTPYEKEFFRKDGSRVPVLVGGTLFDDGNGVFFVLDMTEHRLAVEQLQAAQRMEAVGRLAGGVAHEINNALQGVLGFSRFALTALPDGDPVRADVEQVERSAYRAATITQQLLAYSRRQLLRPAAHDLAAVLAGFEPMLRQALGPERHLQIERPAERALILADRGQIEQVLLNLTLNARDAMRAGGRLVISVGFTELADADLRDGRYVTLAVADDGHGMDGPTLAQIFDPFFTTKRPGEGTGLGLAVVQGIIRQSGGQISVTSERGKGATFRILLPRAAAPSRTIAALDAPSLHGGSETILLVDDEEAVRAYVGRLLRELGYTVLETSTPSAALAELDAAEERGSPVSLIVSDVIMPAGGGEAIGRGVEAWQGRRGGRIVPILYISGHSDEQVAHRMPEGRAAFIQKPFDADLLARTARTLLDSTRAEP